MSKALKLSESTWNNIYHRLVKDYPPSVILIREKMKVVLGFTTRRHREWILYPGYDGQGEYKETICLDFYDESKRVFFLLKYGDLFQGSVEHEH